MNKKWYLQQLFGVECYDLMLKHEPLQTKFEKLSQFNYITASTYGADPVMVPWDVLKSCSWVNR